MTNAASSHRRVSRIADESTRAAAERTLESRIAVLTAWGFLGVLGAGFVLSGFGTPSLALGITGYGFLAAAFVAHLVLNRLYRTDFGAGQVAAGLSIFALALLGFVASWLLTPGYDPTRVALGLIGSAVVVGGAFATVATRFGLRGSFSMFHSRRPAASGRSASSRR